MGLEIGRQYPGAGGPDSSSSSAVAQSPKTLPSFSQAQKPGGRARVSSSHAEQCKKFCHSFQSLSRKEHFRVKVADASRESGHSPITVVR